VSHNRPVNCTAVSSRSCAVAGASLSAGDLLAHEQLTVPVAAGRFGEELLLLGPQGRDLPFGRDQRIDQPGIGQAWRDQRPERRHGRGSGFQQRQRRGRLIRVIKRVTHEGGNTVRAGSTNSVSSAPEDPPTTADRSANMCSIIPAATHPRKHFRIIVQGNSRNPVKEGQPQTVTRKRKPNQTPTGPSPRP
jgi:hypothetical protein